MDFTWLDLLRLLILVTFGTYMAYRDLKERKIYNRHLAILGGLGVVLFLSSFKFELIPSLLTNFLLALLLGIVLWKVGLWGAGDGKLLAIVTLYMPFKLYLPFFYSQVIFINTLILTFFIWFFPLILKTSREEKISTFKKTVNIKNLLRLSITLFGLFYFINYLISSLDLGLYTTGYLITLAISLSLFAVINKLLPEKSIHFLASLCLLRIFFDTTYLSYNFIASFAITTLALLIFYWIGSLSYYISYEEKYLKELKPGDVPTGAIHKKNAEVDLKEFLIKHFGKNNKILSEGFSSLDLKKISKLRELDGFLIKKYISFSPLILASGIFVFIFGVDLVVFIFSELHHLFLEVY